MKILHLAANDKFINHAYRSFENVYPDQNEVFILSAANLEDQYKHDPAFVRISHKELVNPAFYKRLKSYDCVILHSLLPQFLTILNFAPRGIKFVWLGWGFDYYRYVYADKREILLPLTTHIFDHIDTGQKKSPLYRRALRWVLRGYNHQSAIEKISSFSPVLKQDYDLVKQAGILKSVPPYIPWNYGSLEEAYAKNMDGKRVNGNAILVGNSADLGNNHLDAFESLRDIKGRDIVCPLSYGDDGGKGAVIAAGEEKFGTHFKPLLGFMPIEDYLQTLISCGYVIMNHKRQQAVGTIVQMMFLGAKIFLREECPSYTFFKNEGAYIFSVQELECDTSLLDKPLTEKEIAANIDILKRHWSKKSIDAKTRHLVEEILSSS